MMKVVGPCLLFVNFHHVREKNDPRFPKLHHRTPAEVRAQIRLLSETFDFPSPSRVRRMMIAGEPIDQKLCVFSFDDGLRDHFENVLPILAEFGIQALFCINTGPWTDGRMLSVHMAHLLSAAYSYAELAEDFERSALEQGVAAALADVPASAAREQYRYDTPEDARVKLYLNAIIPQAVRSRVLERVFKARISQEDACVRMHYLTPAMTREMARAGHEVGIHTHRHLHLASASADVRRADLQQNLSCLCEAIDSTAPIAWISYPYGSPSSYNDDVINEARRIGCDVGLTMTRGLNFAGTVSAMRLKRVDTNDVVGGKYPVDWDALSR